MRAFSRPYETLRTFVRFDPNGIQFVKFRITHPKKLAVEHRVIMTLGVIGQDAPATLDAVSDPVGQTNAARTHLAVSGYRHRASV